MSMNQEPDRGTSYPDPKPEPKCFICGRVFIDNSVLDDDFEGTGESVCTMCHTGMDDQVYQLIEILRDKVNALKSKLNSQAVK